MSAKVLVLLSSLAVILAPALSQAEEAQFESSCPVVMVRNFASVRAAIAELPLTLEACQATAAKLRAERASEGRLATQNLLCHSTPNRVQENIQMWLDQVAEACLTRK